MLAYITIALTPTLLAHHDVLLEVMSRGAASIITGGALARVGREPLAVVVLAPMTCVFTYALFYWWGGRLWGDRLISYYTKDSPRRRRWVTRGEAWVRRWGVWALVVAWFVPVPVAVVEVLCGTSGMPFVRYFVGAFVGRLLWVGFLIGLGWSIGHPAVHVVSVIGRYGLYVTAGIVVLMVAVAVSRSRNAGAQS